MRSGTQVKLFRGGFGSSWAGLGWVACGSEYAS